MCRSPHFLRLRRAKSEHFFPHRLAKCYTIREHDPMHAVALLRGLDADPLRLWWPRGLCVLWRLVCSPAPTSWTAWAYRCTPYLLCSCHPFSVGRLLDVGLVLRVSSVYITGHNTHTHALIVQRSPRERSRERRRARRALLKGRIGTSARVCAVVGREIEHPTPPMVSCGGGTVARSMRRPPQPTP